MDEDYRAGWMGAPPPPGADMGSYYRGQDASRQLSQNQTPAAIHYPQTAHEGPPPEPPLTASEFLIVAIFGAILVGLGAGVAALLLGWPYLDVALLSASATFVIGLIVRLKVWLLGLALWLALIFLALRLAGVDIGFVVDPVSRIAHDLAQAIDDRLRS